MKQDLREALPMVRNPQWLEKNKGGFMKPATGPTFDIFTCKNHIFLRCASLAEGLN